MTDATEVVVKVMREHHFLTELQSDGTKLYHCGKCCGQNVCLAHSVEDYRAHVARRALDALEAEGYTLMRPVTAAEEAANTW